MAYYITPDEYDEAEKNGISERIVSCRVRVLGWSVEKAINTPVRKRLDRKKWAAVAESNGIKYTTFMRRVWGGMSEEEAATMPLLNPLDNLKESGKTKKRLVSDECIRTAEKNGISYCTLRYRVRNGWDLQRAITEKPAQRGLNNMHS